MYVAFMITFFINAFVFLYALLKDIQAIQEKHLLSKAFEMGGNGESR